MNPGVERRTHLAAAHLYLVCGATPDGHELLDLIHSAAAGGVNIFQLREKHLPDDELTAVAKAAHALCKRLGILFIVNDRPAVALESGADGVHVGQDDMAVTEVRDIVGPDVLIGLSTHAAVEIDAVDTSLVDYIGVGPIHTTPTKPGRPAVGLQLVRHAAERSPVPFFAIGGLNASNIVHVVDAGASRVCVLRAIADSTDPRRSALGLRALLPQ